MRDEIPVTEQEEAAWREMEQRQARDAQQPSSGQSAAPVGAPDRIFLVAGEDVPPGVTFDQLAEVTWCKDRVNHGDIEYVRAKLQGAQQAQPVNEVYAEPPFLQRLRVEFSDLAERQAKLTAFIGTPGFRMLDDADANLLARQGRLHQSLLEVLGQRIQLASAKHAALAAPAAPCNHFYEGRPIDGSNSPNAPSIGVCRKCGHVPDAASATQAADAEAPKHDPKELIDAARQAGWTFLRGADGRYTLQQLPPAHAQSVAPQAGEDARPADDFAYFKDWYDKEAPKEGEAITRIDMARHGWLAGMRFADLFPQPAVQAAPAVPEERIHEIVKLAETFGEWRYESAHNPHHSARDDAAYRADDALRKLKDAVRAALITQGESHE